jgi:phospholipid-transporting ATPase
MENNQGEGPPPRIRRWWPFRSRNRRGDIMGSRRIYIDRPRANAPFRFVGNMISTTKYNLITFLPKNLFEQFQRVANFWFLLIACLQLIPDVSPTNPLASFLPLAFVLSITAIKEAAEDINRFRSDREVNNRPATIIRGGVRTESHWKNIKTGDIVCLHNNDAIPADLVILSTSDVEGNCFVETAAIDGETNLKRNNALRETQAFGEDFSNFDGEIECQTPNPSLNQFNGTMTINGTTHSVGLRQFLFRGCVLKNTEWLYGVAVYTGRDTKIMKNATNPPSKRSLLEREVNYALIQMFLFIIVLCIFCGIMAGSFVSIWGDDNYYLQIRDSGAITGLKGFVTFLILFNTMIPLSLYVTLELVKLVLAEYISNDLKMYCRETDTAAKAKTSNLTEQLGQLEYIFSDKTGTLTANKMEFRQCSINGEVFGTYDPNEKHINEDGEPEPSPPFADQNMMNKMQSGGDQGSKIRLFWTLLAVCHTVMIQQKDGEPTYSASSPDEAALVQAAKDQGFVYHTEQNGSYFIDALGNQEKYEILNVLEFNSDRKRMSIIVRCPDGKIRLFCKGADTVIFQRLASGQDALIGTTVDHLRGFAKNGLRTLNVAYLELSEQEYQEWAAIHKAAAHALYDRETKLDEAAELIEQNMILLGSTAIEDKLQDGVPETIEILSRANLKIWVLTGDKEETAVNIAFSCQLLTNDMYVMTLNADTCPSEEDVANILEKSIGEAKDRNNQPKALVIDGTTMDKIFGNKQLERQLFLLGKECKSVVCCRSSPKQKQLIVELVKRNDNAQCLAIGDGANDVPMIQAAQVGVGISGREGMQAVNSSDYAIAQFRFLERLILIHGRWAYKRLAKLILYSFYKNMAFSLTQFWFAWFSGFSGQTIYDSWAIALFNTLFAFLPILTFAVLDRDVPARKMKEYPQLYESGQKKQEFTKLLFWSWILLGMIQSVINFFLCFFAYKTSIAHWDGTSYNMFAAGMTCYTVLILTINFVVALEINTWTIIQFLALVWTVGSWFLFCVVYQYIGAEDNNEMFYLSNKVFRTPTYWLCVLLATTVCLWPYLSWKVIRRNYFPLNYHIVQEMDSKHGRDKYNQVGDTKI